MEEEIHPHRRANIAFILLIALSIFLMSVHISGFVRGVKDFLFYVLMPTPAAASRILDSTLSIPSSIREIVSIHQENKRLKIALEKYAQMENEYVRAQEENLRLRNLVGFSVPSAARTLVCRVTSREPSSWFESIVIDRGRAEGVTIDSPVFVWVDTRPAVLGRVEEVYEHNAKVVLITNTLSAVPGKLSISPDDGLIEGQNVTQLKMNYVLPEESMTVGAEVQTSPLSTVFPPGLLIGTIISITRTGNDMYHSAEVRPAVNMNSLREVIVVIRDAGSVSTSMNAAVATPSSEPAKGAAQ
jgi:rod shape-determining protein MreC